MPSKIDRIRQNMKPTEQSDLTRSVNAIRQCLVNISGIKYELESIVKHTKLHGKAAILSQLKPGEAAVLRDAHRLAKQLLADIDSGRETDIEDFDEIDDLPEALPGERVNNV